MWIQHPPKSTRKDHIHSLAKAGIGSIPVIGSAAVELFAAVIAPPLEQRRNEWLQNLADRLEKLEESGAVDLEQLGSNEAFVTSVMHATQAALRSHQHEKLTALRNAVINAALPSSPEEWIQQVFVQLVDAFTVWHLRILAFLQNPKAWFLDHGRQPPEFTSTRMMIDLLVAAYPELNGQSQLYNLVESDLRSKDLISGGRLTEPYDQAVLIAQMASAKQRGAVSMMQLSDNYWNRTTEFGNQFLRFITDPADVV